MKKLIAGVATGSVLSLGAVATGGVVPASAAYGPPQPSPVIIKIVKQVTHHKGHISKHRAQKLIKKVRAARKAGVITPRQAKKLIRLIRHDIRRPHR